MNRINHSREDHAFSRYMCVSAGAIDKLQRDYLAGRNLAQSIPGIDATMAAVIVAESLEADRLWDTLPEMLLGKSPPEPQGELSDFGQATLAELFFAAADQAREAGDEKRELVFRALASGTLEELLDSPTASPMLWYDDIFHDVGQELRRLGQPRAVEFFKRALAHNLHHDEGRNAANGLRDVAETYLWLDRLDEGLDILAAMLRNDPADVWTYNLMAILFDGFGLTEIGTQATRRALELIEARGDPHGLRDQLLDCLDILARSERHGREADVDPAVLADLRAALALDFDAGEGRPIADLCRELVPDLDQVPVKRRWEKPDLPPPDVVREQQKLPPQRKPGRNDPCWCGSGKKYKHCHMRADRRRRS
jgi:tetratricopeptide (TPR) repeat protein